MEISDHKLADILRDSCHLLEPMQMSELASDCSLWAQFMADIT